MKKATTIQIIVLLATVFLLDQATYTVSETEQVIITQFGDPVGDPVISPGLHFKVPFIQRVNVFDNRFLEWDGTPNQVPTRDRRFILLVTYRARRSSNPSDLSHCDGDFIIRIGII